MPTTSNFGWTTPADTDLVKDGAAAIRTLGNGIDTSLVDLKGGTTGQVLSKASNTDLDFTWSSVDPLTILDAKGDLISATAADTPARLASSGVNGDVLTVDTSTATGLKWAAAGGALTLSTIASGTMPVATALTITGLTQDFFCLRISGLLWDSGADYLQIRLNSNTNTVYSYVTYQINAANFYKVSSTGDTKFLLTAETSNRDSGDNSFTVFIQNAKSAGYHTISSVGHLENTSNADFGASMQGFFEDATAITSITVMTNSAYQFSGGTYKLIGG